MWITRKHYEELKSKHDKFVYTEAKREINEEPDIEKQVYFDDYHVICSKQHYFLLKDAVRICQDTIKEAESDVEKYKKKYAEEFQKRMQLVDVLSRMEKCENNTPENTEKGESN